MSVRLKKPFSHSVHEYDDRVHSSRCTPYHRQGTNTLNGQLVTLLVDLHLGSGGVGRLKVAILDATSVLTSLVLKLDQIAQVRVVRLDGVTAATTPAGWIRGGGGNVMEEFLDSPSSIGHC